MKDKDINKTIDSLASNDLDLLVNAKAEAQKKVSSNPNKNNLQALAVATKMLNEYLEQQEFNRKVDKSKSRLKNYQEVLDYAKANNRKVCERKVHYDIEQGKLIRQADKTFLCEDVDKYLSTLPFIATPTDLHNEAMSRQEAKELAEIRIKEAQAKTVEHKLAVLEGKFLPKSEVYATMAARIAVLRDSIKNNLEAQAIEIIKKVNDGISSEKLALDLCEIIDFSLSEFAKPLEITVDFSHIIEGESDDGDE